MYIRRSLLLVLYMLMFARFWCVLYRLVGISGRHGTDRGKNCETRSRIMKKDEFMCARAHGMRIIIIMNNNDKESDGRDHD